jgi:protein-S-isoprenylcysteine O-methyltransferase Ste14
VEGFYRLPLAVRVLIIASVTFGTAFGVLAVQRSHGTWAGSLAAHLVVAAIVGAVIGVVMVVTERRLRRDFGSIEQFIGYARALRTGELPADIEPDVWRAWLNRSRAANRQTLVAPAVLVVFGVLPRLFGSSGYSWVIGVIFALLAMLSLASWWLTRRRISRLAAAIEQ